MEKGTYHFQLVLAANVVPQRAGGARFADPGRRVGRARCEGSLAGVDDLERGGGHGGGAEGRDENGGEGLHCGGGRWEVGNLGKIEGWSSYEWNGFVL